MAYSPVVRTKKKTSRLLAGGYSDRIDHSLSSRPRFERSLESQVLSTASGMKFFQIRVCFGNRENPGALRPPPAAAASRNFRGIAIGCTFLKNS